MAQVREDTQGKKRDLPIAPQLRNLLLSAAEASGVDLVRVTSGGQCRIGTCTKRTGSQRHDDGNAADLQLIVGERTLKFTSNNDLPTFKTFVTAAARAGATGIGAGVDYMGDDTIHVGFGARAVWGAGGRSANAPPWIKDAARAGWQSVKSAIPGGADPGMSLENLEEGDLDSSDEELEEDYGQIETEEGRAR